MKTPSRIRIVLSFFLAVTSVAWVAKAEESPAARGRLPDGRAFRVDPHGNQLIDYIAELELSVEELAARSNRIEAILREKDAQLAACAQRARESTSSPSSESLQSTAATTQPCPNQQTACSAMVAECELRNRTLRDDFDVERVKLSRSLAACQKATVAGLANVTKDDSARASLRSPKVPQDVTSAGKQ